MATYVGGDKLVLNKEYVTAGANLADKTLIDAAGAVLGNAAALCFGVVEKDTPSGELATVKTTGILEVLATGTVTKGANVEGLQSTRYANISGTSTSITVCGVQDRSAGYALGRALSTGVAGDTVLVELYPFSSLKPV